MVIMYIVFFVIWTGTLIAVAAITAGRVHRKWYRRGIDEGIKRVTPLALPSFMHECGGEWGQWQDSSMLHKVWSRQVTQQRVCTGCGVRAERAVTPSV